MKVYIGTETSRTIDLTAEEFGAYERLRRYYWEHEGLPNDDRRLMRITGVDPERWEGVRSAICWLFEEGWRLPALDADRDDAAAKRAKAVERSQKAHAARYGKPRPATGSASSSATSNPTSSAYSSPKELPEAVLDAVLEDCPLASASEHSLYEERLALTRAHARQPDAPIFIDIPETEAEGREFLMREGLWPKQLNELLPILMRGDLERAQISEALERKRA